MKKFLLGATALVTLTSVAVAADLPSRRAPPVYVPPPPPAFTWTGFYAGFNAGVAFNSYTDYSLTGNTAATAANVNAALVPGALKALADLYGSPVSEFADPVKARKLFGNAAGALGSGISPIFGGNYGGIVAGVEADIDGLTNKGSGNYLGAGTLADTFYHSRTDFVGTARGRIGYAFGNLLVYGTGGFAYGDVHDNVVTYNTAGAPTFGGGASRIQTGYAYGGGVEYAIPTASFVNFFKASAVTVKAEFVHYDLGSTNQLIPNLAGTGASYNARIHNDGNIARVGVNYKFGAPAAPVVARY